MRIRPYRSEDWPGVWEILEPVFREGESYMFSPQIDEEEARRAWIEATQRVYVAEAEGRIVGTFYLKPNQPGLGDHLCNAGYAVHPGYRGRGTARAMALYSLAEAVGLGYEAMQFNAVVSTNEPAVRLWRSLGFETVGRVPGAFRSRRHGKVEILIMYRRLKETEQKDRVDE